MSHQKLIWEVSLSTSDYIRKLTLIKRKKKETEEDLKVKIYLEA